MDLIKKYQNYSRLQNIKKCTDGKSPANVYQCELDSSNIYLKTIHKRYSGTTYSVRREADIMKWLSGKLNVPNVIESGEINGEEFLIMSEITGNHIDDYIKEPELYVAYLAEAIHLLQKVDISECPFFSNVDMRLAELDFLLNNNLADVNTSNREKTTEFHSPQELYKWLCDNKPSEEFVFTHGDIGANLFVKNGEIFFYDLARMGVADRWVDTAFAVRNIRKKCPDYEQMFFDKLGAEPNYEKINYYILLDEMF